MEAGEGSGGGVDEKQLSVNEKQLSVLLDMGFPRPHATVRAPNILVV